MIKNEPKTLPAEQKTRTTKNQIHLNQKQTKNKHFFSLHSRIQG